MKRVALLLLAMAMPLFVYNTSFAGGTTTANASINLTVNASVTVTTIRSAINLGTGFPGDTKTVDPITGGNNAAAFSITGPNNWSITPTWSASVNITNGTDNIAFAPSVSGNTVNTQTSSTLLTSGTAFTTAATGSPVYYLWVGGSLTIPNTASSGAYAGNVVITLTY
ncbi:MAG: DUF4402 domain-containing protein [Candidatus Kryptoniota bacterium]